MAAWTLAEYNSLKAAIAGGVLSVRYDGPPARSVTYKSTAEMLQVLSMMERSLGGTATVAYAQFSKGA